MSLKHVVHKRVHKERHQPAARQRLGYLEKHKDYAKRAKDYHKKQDAIKKMHQKAYFKNEDEFAFGMLSHKQQNGKTTKIKEHLSQDELALLESQDARYIAMREQIDKKAARKRAEQLHFLDAGGPRSHVLFVDDDDEDADAEPASRPVTAAADSSAPPAASAKTRKKRRRLEDFDVAAHFDTHPALMGARANRPRLSQLEKSAFAASDQSDPREAYRELFGRQERAKKLGRVREELDLRNHLRGKGRKMKVSDAGKDQVAVYKWFPERKR